MQRSSSAMLAALLAARAVSSTALAQAPDEPAPDARRHVDEDSDSAAELAAPPPPSGPPEWSWSQILAAPHISSRLTTLAVDPRDPRRIFVGTDGGSILFSDDSGMTWRELALRQVVRTQRDVRQPPLLNNTIDYPRLFHLPRPPFRPSSPFVTLFEGFPRMTPWEQWPRDIFRFYVISDFINEYSSLLSDTIRGSQTDPIRRIEVCPGARYPLYAATQTEVFASDDDGYTWTPVLRNPDRSSIHQVVCNPDRPNHVVVATDRGAYYSVDGGSSFALDNTGWPTGRVQAVDISEEGEVLVAAGFRLFRGRPQEGFVPIYPNFEDSSTAPWEQISWIARDGPEIWLATQDGVRRSFDGGESWDNVAPLLFSRRWASQVLVGRDNYGRRHVAVLSRECPSSARSPFESGCRSTEVQTTTDGVTWSPFFADVTRRSVQQMAYVPAPSGQMADGRWLVVTGGELWTNRQPGTTVFAPETRRWAQARLHSTPPMDRVINEGLRPLELRVEDINSTISGARRRGIVPRVQMGFDWTALTTTGNRSVRIIAPSERFRGTDRRFWYLLINFSWYLGSTVQQRAEADSTRRNLNEMRDRVGFVLEDAWHERNMHLRRLVLGTSDLLQAEILRERVLVLEAVLSFWLRQPLEALN